MKFTTSLFFLVLFFTVRVLDLDRKGFWQKLYRAALFCWQDLGDRHRILVRNGLVTDWQIPHWDRELWHSSSEGERGRDNGKEEESAPFPLSVSAQKAVLGRELHWRGWAALSVCGEGWTAYGRGAAQEVRKTMWTRDGWKRGKLLSLCFFHQRQFDRAEPTL